MLSAHEQLAWDDILRHHDAEGEEPDLVGQHPARRVEVSVRAIDETPGAVAAGVWIMIILVLVGAEVAGLAVGGATALGWALWHWWPKRAGADAEDAAVADPAAAHRQTR